MREISDGEIKIPFEASSLSQVVPYLSLIFNTNLTLQVVDGKSDIIIEGRKQLCESLGARLQYYDNTVAVDRPTNISSRPSELHR